VTESGADFSIEDEPQLVAPVAPKRRRRWLRIGAPLGAVVLVAGGIAAAQLAGKLSGTATPGLASALPAKTIAFAQVNLDPSAGQKLAMYDIANKFPEVKDKVSKDDPAGSLINSLIAPDGSDSSLSWNKIKEWAGVRIGAALLTTGGGQPYPLIAIQLKDEKKAKDGLAKLAQDTSSDPIVYEIKDGYAYASTTQADLDDALKDLAANGALSKTSGYASAADTVGDGDILGGYANLAELQPLAKTYLSGNGLQSLFDVTEASGISTPEVDTTQLDHALAELTGEVSFDVDLNGGGGRLNVDIYDQKQTGSLAGSVSGITALPADSVLALDLRGLGKSYQKQWSTIGPQLMTFAGQIFDGTDIKLPDDLSAVLGDDIAFSLNGDADAPDIGAVVTGGDADRAKRVIEELIDKYGDGTQEPVGVYGSGSTFTVATSSSYAAELSKGGSSLGSTSLFRSAVPDAADAQFAMYANVQELLKFAGSEPSGDAAMIAAVGMTERLTSSGVHVELNLVLN
jgi:hypothetical protein